MRQLLVALMACTLPGSGAIALVSHTAALSSSTTNSATTVTINSTGATLKIAVVTVYNVSAASVTVSDPGGDTWHALTNYTFSTTNVAIWYAYSTGSSALATSASDSITVSCSTCYPGVALSAWSGTQTGSSNPYGGTQTGASGHAASLATPAITPSLAGELVITGFGNANGTGTNFTVGSPFGALDSVNFMASGAQAVGRAAGYLIQGTASTVSATWSQSAADHIVVVAASFRATAAQATSSTQLVIN